ncbi:hypothetical protein [Burkholderia cenocepacia]|uniref:hypothetical protein n=1 Tax=Burkholderia cenocepacia TaxID=95486 RepID=UPI0022386C23|nr:hypothetical protein [Burkholderia cenocepacia]MCW5141071.1 hypothetical protein [Burkholderia cenocepacia]
MTVIVGSVWIEGTSEQVDPTACAHTYTWNADGTLATDSFTHGHHTWTKTYTYADGQLVGESVWVQS